VEEDWLKNPHLTQIREVVRSRMARGFFDGEKEPSPNLSLIRERDKMGEFREGMKGGRMNRPR